jgi:hypothetical protein
MTIAAPSSGVALSVSGIASQYGATIAGSLTGNGMFVSAGSTSSQVVFDVANGAQSVNFLRVFGDGGTVMGSATGGDEGLGTINMQGCFVNGAACLTSTGAAVKTASGVFTIGSSSCTINLNGGGINTCTFNSTGEVTVNFTSSYFTTGAVCVSSPIDASPPNSASSSGTGITSSVNVLMRNPSGTLVNSSFSLICSGS